MIYFTFGAHKTGSTYSHNLIKNLLSVNGHIQYKIKFSNLKKIKINFLTESELDNKKIINMLVRYANEDKIYCIKTHSYPGKFLNQLKSWDKIYCFVSKRNIVDRSLSLIDASKKARTNQFLNFRYEGFSNIYNFYDALKSIDNVKDCEKKWLKFPNTISMDFKNITLNSDILLQKVSKQLNFKINSFIIDSVLCGTNYFINTINNINKGVQHRGDNELSKKERLIILGYNDKVKLLLNKKKIKYFNEVIKYQSTINTINKKFNLSTETVMLKVLYIYLDDGIEQQTISKVLEKYNIPIIRSKFLLNFIIFIKKNERLFKNKLTNFILNSLFKNLLNQNIYYIHNVKSFANFKKIKNCKYTKKIIINNFSTKNKSHISISDFIKNPLIIT